MTRRILILLASFLVLFGCFIAYRFIFSMPKEGISKRPPSVKDPSVMVSLTASSMPSKPGAPTLGPGANLHVEARDKFNHLQYVLESPHWNRDPDGSWVLQKPIVTMYQKGGIVISIRGDKGRVFAEEVKSNAKINSGSLAGNVVISIDRNANQAAPIADRPKDEILIKMDDVSFDNNRLEISSPNEVQVTSYEADIDGKGLTINLNESPSELRLLRLDQGRKMTIRDEGLTLSTPGGNALSGVAVRGGAGSATPTTAPVAVAAGVAAQGTLEKIKGKSAQEAATELEAMLPQPSADQGKPDSTGKKIPPARNIYLAQFDSPDNNLNVISENGTLQNANKVTLLFEWGGQAKRTSDSSPFSAGPRTTAAASQPASQPAGKEKKPTVITWSGPLELRPVGYVPKPNKKKYEVHAQGPQLTLADKQTIVSCGEIFFHQPGQTGELVGNGSKPVTMTLSSGETILAESVLFDRQNGVADLIGKGTITQPYRGGSEVAIGGAASEPAPAPFEHPADDFIQWTRSVAVLFGESRTGGTARIKQFVKEATFYGHVELHRPTTGDSLQCEDNLHVLMARLQGGRNTLQRAVATGDVKAHYEKSDIEGQKLVMDFEAVKKGKGSLQNRPSTLEVIGAVTIRTKDAKDAKNNSIVTADRIHASVINQTAELYGSPAVMMQDQKKVTGNEIHIVAGDRQVGKAHIRELVSAQVVGAGTADFPNDRDPLSGTKFGQPKSTHVSWAQSMNFDGAANAADVKGDVHLDSELDKMRCQTVHLDFDRSAKSAEPSTEESTTEPAGTAPGKNLALGIGKFGTRQLAKIDAEGKIKVDSRKTDKDGHLIQLLDLNCSSLTYTAKDKTMVVNGAGNMLAGDFRQPPPTTQKAAVKESEDAMPVEDVQRPSASAFEWHKRMTLTQLDDGQRTVLLEGDVVLVHRSGKEVELTDPQKKQWNVMDWQDLRPGRHIVLGCDNLQAAFDKPAEKGQTSQPSTDQSQQQQQGPRVGNLRNFQAWQGVNLKDGTFQVLGQRLIYDVKDADGKVVDVVKIFGYLEGQKKTLAQIISADPRTGRLQQQQAPEITWNRKDNSIETKNVSVVGGR
jgi:lipopolysaccharide export system protein LptA